MSIILCWVLMTGLGAKRSKLIVDCEMEKISMHVVSCCALHFQHGKKQWGCRGNKSRISAMLGPFHSPSSSPSLHPATSSSSLASSQWIWSSDLRPAYLGEQAWGWEQGSCPKLRTRSQSRDVGQRIRVHSRQPPFFFLLLLLTFHGALRKWFVSTKSAG